MKISLGSIKFNNIRELTTYLEQTDERSLAPSLLIPITIEDDAEQDSNQELLDFLAKDRQNVIFKLNLRTTRPTAAQNALQQEADTIYLEQKEKRLLQMNEELAEKIKILATENQVFEQFLNEHLIPSSDTKQFAANDELFSQWMQGKYADVNSLLNALSEIKNKADLPLIATLFVQERERMNSNDNKNNVLNAGRMSRLLTVLGKSDHQSVVSLLTLAGNLLANAPEMTNELFDDLIIELDLLAEFKKEGSIKAYRSLLRWSLSYNLTHARAFPLNEILKFNSVPGEHSQAFKELFDAVMIIADQADFDVEAELIQQVLEKTGMLVQAKILKMPEIVSFLTVLFTATNGTKRELERYVELLTTLSETEQEILSYWTKTIMTLAQNTSSKQKGLLLLIQEQLIAHRIRAKEIAELFDVPPYPEADAFLVELKKYSDQLQNYLYEFDLDPKGARSSQYNEGHFLVKPSEEIINEQFDTSQVSRVVANIERLFEGSHLAAKQQFDLAQQVIYINAIGKDAPLILHQKEYLNLTLFSRAELRALTQLLVLEVRKADQSDHDKLKAQLNLLAVLREHYFRSTGIFINSTQLMSVLVSLHDEHQNVLIDIDSTKRESAVVALLAVMQWVAADGGSVDICLPEESRLTDDHQATGFSSFFASLEIPSSVITTDAGVGTYKSAGINYATLKSMAAYRARAREANEPLVVQKGGRALSSNLILAQYVELTDESSLVSRKSTVSAVIRDLICFYKSNGRIVNLEHIDSKEELIAQHKRLAIDSAYSIPSHQKKRHKARLTKEAAAQSEEKKLSALAQNTITESVDIIQRVVLQQFDDWQVLLHLLYPEPEWNKLDRVLAKEKESLISALSGQWVRTLEQSGLNTFDLFNGPKQQQIVNEAIDRYEESVNLIWNNMRIVLKEKAESRVSEGTVNALRCKCLEEVNLSSQISAERMAVRQQKQREVIERKKASRSVASGLNVEGALLNYSSGDVEAYRAPFAASQFDLIARDMEAIINHSSLSYGTKDILLGEMAVEDKRFLSLELVLIHFNEKLIEPNKFAEQYKMQPVIQELIRVHKEAGIAESNELKQLKEIYLNNAVTDVVTHLEQTLSWAMPEQQGFWYWIERTAVKNAAKELLAAAASVKNAVDVHARQQAIKHLYRTLSRHQAEIKDLWIFSFGHKNTRTLINDTLTTLNGLTVLGSGEDELNEQFIIKCQEESLGDTLKREFINVLVRMEKQGGLELKNASQWQEIIARLNEMMAENDTPFVINEMYWFVSKACNEQPRSEIYPALISLRGSLRTIMDKHRTFLNSNRLLQVQEEKIQSELNAIEGCDIQRVRVKKGHTGFTEYFDVIIEGTVPEGLLPAFERHNALISGLKARHEEMQGQRTRALIDQEQLLNLIDLVVNRQPVHDDVIRFPVSMQEKVQRLMSLSEYLAGSRLDDLSIFPQEVQNWFHDLNLLQLVNLNTPQTRQKGQEFTELFRLDVIEQLKDEQIKAEFITLYQKMHRLMDKDDSASSRSWYSRWTTFISDLFVSPSQEEEEDWNYHFAELKEREKHLLNRFLTNEIKNAKALIEMELNSLHQEVGKEIGLLSEKIDVLEEHIKSEERNKGVIIHRVDQSGELYDLVTDIKASQQEHSEVDSLENSSDFYDSENGQELYDEDEMPYFIGLRKE